MQAGVTIAPRGVPNAFKVVQDRNGIDIVGAPALPEAQG